jgi:hypothetical protein
MVMRALVVFESMFGNTKTIATAVAEGVASLLPVDTVAVDVAPSNLPADVGLIVVGAPTHAFGMSKRSTRESAAEQRSQTVTSMAIGLREWLASVEPPAYTVAAAAFDTRINRPRVPGSAAHKAERRLRSLGFRSAASPTTFWVTGTAGPLADGELDRARRWGEMLAAGVVSSPAASKPVTRRPAAR